MATNKHPLDLFRASKSGFDSATRDPERGRRRVSGRVLVSTPREGVEGAAPAVAPREDVDEAEFEEAATLEAPSIDETSGAEPAIDEAAMLDEPVVESSLPLDRPSPSAADFSEEEDDDEDGDDAFGEEADDQADEAPANALEAILAQRRALDAENAASEAASSDGAKPRRRVDVPQRPLQPVGLDASSSGPASVSRPLNQVAQQDGAGLPPGISTRTRSTSYKLLAAAGALVVVLVGWSMLTGGDGAEDGVPPLSKAAAANAETDIALGSAPPSEYTVQAAVYGTNLLAAQAAADALDALGFRDVELTGVEDGEGGFTDITLIVGRAASQRDLETVRTRLRNTPVGKEKNPFYEAFIVGHPAAR